MSTAAASFLLPFPVQAEDNLKAPFPWFGGKSHAADVVWERFGDVTNYCEPFFGSGAVLLGRYTHPKNESINDLDCYVANFWRALQSDPDAVAHYADWPVNEADLRARHSWLMKREKFRKRMKTDPYYYDAKIAGWWVWGQCIWLGAGWCAGRKHLQMHIPYLGTGGRGVHRETLNSEKTITKYFWQLANRMRRVRVCCENWDRILGPASIFNSVTTGVFLDPPYSKEANREAQIYAVEDLQIAHSVREWAIANGDNPELRIALCGYEGEHIMPDSWDCESFKVQGGYALREGRGQENATRERIWFSPHCLKNKQGSLF